MSVLILDMKFPKTCAECEWSRYSFPNAWCGRTHKTADIEIAKNGRPDWCPLVPVPDHGRLIDADVLEKEAQKRMLICSKNDNQFQQPYEIMRAIALAPTIIPAEEGK